MSSKGVAPHGVQVPVAPKSALFVNCSSPNLPITAPPLQGHFQPSSITHNFVHKLQVPVAIKLPCNNPSSLVSDYCKLCAQQHASTVGSHLAMGYALELLEF